MTLLLTSSRPAEPPASPPPSDSLRQALLESRERWRDLCLIAADIAFETDAAGRFVFLSPDVAMGWPAAALLGRPSTLLLPPDADLFNPFTVVTTIRGQRVWVRRPDGTLCWMSFTAAPIHDIAGVLTGVRGIGRDLTHRDRAEGAMAQALRRSELIDHIVWHMRTEILAPRMMVKVLQALVGTLGADGAMVVDCAPASATGGGDAGDDPQADLPALRPPDLLYEVGADQPPLRDHAVGRLRDGYCGPGVVRFPDGRTGLLCATPIRFEGCPGLLLWRTEDRRPWDADDLALLGAAIGTVRVVLEHGAIQQEMARQARTDALTGLSNRRAFHDDAARRIDRLELDGLPGTLMFVDLDNFKPLNDVLGHEAGDAALRLVGKLLRQATRPGDLVARLGGDEFAIWFDGMDQLAAAERAEQLRRQVPLTLSAVNPLGPPLTMSIGIAGRWPGSGLQLADLLRRADAAMYQVKHTGRGHWHVWQDQQAEPDA